MNPASPATPFDEKSPHAVAGEAMQIVFRTGNGQAYQLDQLFAPAGQVLSQS